jgi:hypothetical protein
MGDGRVKANEGVQGDQEGLDEEYQSQLLSQEQSIQIRGNTANFLNWNR